MFKKRFDLFSQPYPCDAWGRKKWGLILWFSFFVFLFLLLFQPFGLNRYALSSLLFICLGYGLMCALAMGVNLWGVMPLCPNLFDNTSWTVGKQILWTCWIILTVAVFNIMYAVAIGIAQFSFFQIIYSIAQVLLIGIFPVSALVIGDYLRLFRKHANKADELAKSISHRTFSDSTSLVITSKNGKERLQLSLRELLYITSADNYVEIHYCINNSTKKSLLRETLKNVKRQLAHPQIVRCHRSYIANLTHLVNIKGNAQGYVIWLRGVDDEIPVSRSHIDQVMQRIEEE